MRPAGPTDGDQTEGTRKGEGRGRGIELSDPARVNLLPAHEPPDRSRRGNEADSLGRQLFPPHYFGGYEVQGCRARRWFSANSLPARNERGRAGERANSSKNAPPLPTPLLAPQEERENCLVP